MTSQQGRVAGKTAIVTGGARGIGRAISSLLAREGARVVIADVDAANAEVAVRDIETAGGTAYFCELDVQDESQWLAALGGVISRYGFINVLVNNAGISLQANVVDTTLEEWRRVMSINCQGTFLGIKHTIPFIAQAGGGSIVNLSSVDGIVASSDLAAYNASKGAIRLLSKSAALYCGEVRDGVRVNSVHPSFVRGQLTETYLRGLEDPDAGLRAIEQAHPIGCIGEPDDIAYGVLYLASDESKWVTGSELVIDGGWTAT